MLWKNMLLGESRAGRLFEPRLYALDASRSAEIIFAPEKIRALDKEARRLFRDLPDTLQPGFFLARIGAVPGAVCRGGQANGRNRRHRVWVGDDVPRKSDGLCVRR